MKWTHLLLITLLPLSSHAIASLEEQVDVFQRFAGNPTSNTQNLSKTTHTLFTNLENSKAAIKGVLYWGGTDKTQSRAQSALTGSSQQAFCNAGFSNLFYVYKKNVGPSSINCGSNTIPYQVSGQVGPSNHMVRTFMETLHRIIKSNGKLGPAYLHCWWGIHASNTFASIALKQFCNYSNEQAVTYWNKFGHDPDPNDRALSAAGKEENRNKIRNFQPYADLQITPEERSLICY